MAYQTVPAANTALLIDTVASSRGIPGNGAARGYDRHDVRANAQCVHQTAFASGATNDLVGWIAGALSFYNATFYRHFHAWHHRYTQDPGRDPELISPPDRAGDRPSAASLNSGP
jgi:hypothetical protein